SRVRRAKGIAAEQFRARRVQESRGRTKKIFSRVSAGNGFAGRRGEFERHAISGGRLCRCDWSLQRQRVSRGDEETQHAWARCGPRFQDASAEWCHRQSFYSWPDLEKHGHARASWG